MKNVQHKRTPSYAPTAPSLSPGQPCSGKASRIAGKKSYEETWNLRRSHARRLGCSRSHAVSREAVAEFVEQTLKPAKSAQGLFITTSTFAEGVPEVGSSQRLDLIDSAKLQEDLDQHFAAGVIAFGGEELCTIGKIRRRRSSNYPAVGESPRVSPCLKFAICKPEKSRRERFAKVLDGGWILVRIHTPQFLDGNVLLFGRREQVGNEFSRRL